MRALLLVLLWMFLLLTLHQIVISLVTGERRRGAPRISEAGTSPRINEDDDITSAGVNPSPVFSSGLQVSVSPYVS